VPIVVGAFAMAVERLLLRRLAGIDHLYGLLFTFGLALVLEGIFRDIYGSAGLPYATPEQLRGLVNLGFTRVPLYRLWVVAASLVVCLASWFLIERTRLGSYLRAGTENPRLVQALGINLPLMVTLTYGLGAGLAAFAGVLAAPIYQVHPLMGSNLLIIAFAVVVIGGLGSTFGAIVIGLALGVIEGLSKVIYPEISSTTVFIIMALVLLLRPAGLFGREA
jgi:branched-chain amino acid transport system permease protein